MRTSFTILAGACLVLSVCATVANATQLLSVHPDTKAEYARLLELAPESRTCGAVVTEDGVEFAAQDERADELRALGFDVEVRIDDLEGFYASRLHRDGPFGDYHTYDEAIEAMDALAATYPALMTPRSSIGQTIEGREIWVYKISDNPGVDEDEPEIFFNAYIHSREAITFEILYDLSQHLLEGHGNDPRATAIVDGREIWILPVVNPDGVQYNYQTNPNGGGMWRKNRRHNGGSSYGVDLNRNFGYEWGYDNTGSSPYSTDETYRGTGPFSEPETAALRDFVNGREFAVALNFHSYSNLNLHAWGYEQYHCPDHEALFHLGHVRAQENGYSPGAGWEILYRTNGDANDWMYGEQETKPAIFSYVTEVGSSNDGFWPAEYRIPQLVNENREANLRAIELADNPFRVLPPGYAAVETEGSVPGNFTLTWNVPDPDPDNPAVEWNLIEGAGHFVGADDLEGDNVDRWDSIGWSYVTNRSHSPSHSFYSGEDNRLHNILESKRGHLVQPGEDLRFWTHYQIEGDWDYGYVEIATSAREFLPLQGTITTNSDPNDRNFGNGVTGNSGGWVEAVFDLADYEGEVVWIRFRYNTDGYVTEEGWYVDDIEPSDLFATETLVASGVGAQEYTFTNHPEGDFSYLVQSVDVEGNQAIYSMPRTLEVEGLSDIAVGWGGLELLSRNPVSGKAALQYTIPQDARPGESVELTIHDINGRMVAALPAGDGAPGSLIEAEWNAQGSTPGLYFARIIHGRHVAHQRIVLMP